jgi:hypothetical protein
MWSNFETSFSLPEKITRDLNHRCSRAGEHNRFPESTSGNLVWTNF